MDVRRTASAAARRAWRLAVPERLRRRLGPRLRRLLPVVAEVGARRSAAGRPGGEADRIVAGAGPRFPRVPERVSVIVPTLDAGPDFGRHLAWIREQQGLGDLELIVIDSGSSDDTCAVAEDSGARVMQVPPGEFNHGLTRNRAVEAARGEVVVMTVQDAAFLTRTALRDLVLTLKGDRRMAAVSARQVPRTGADLYGSFVVLMHYRAMWRNGRRRLPADRLPPGARPTTAAERRSASTVDDVCAAIRRSAWEEIGFSELDFAEDLEFGVRAVERGWTIGLSESVAVAHSHRRDAPYHLRRGVAERLFVAPMVADDVRSHAAREDTAVVIASGRALMEEVEGAMPAADGGVKAPLVAQFEGLRTQLREGPSRCSASGELAALDRLLAAHDAGRAAANGPMEELRRDLLRVLDWPTLDEFVQANRAAPAADGHEFAAKLTAGVLGRALGDSMRSAGGGGRVADRLLAGL
jgi:GT2 family glycosyltransferase